MCVPDSKTRLQPGLPVEEIEERLVASARRQHLEERNVAYWLHEVATRALYKKRGFASIGDYASELIEMKPRKAQYLVFIAGRLERLPGIAAAFDSGELSWTKAREIVRVATPETERQWLDDAMRLSSRDLEKKVRDFEGRDSGEFVTLTISLPIELFVMWNDCHELTERLSGSELERFQVLEPMMAEYLSTFVPLESENGRSPHETEEESSLPEDVRGVVLERDGYRCSVPGCSMRKMLEVHHLEFRSRGGGHDPANLTTICRIHHGLIHSGVCRLSGTAPEDLTFERPRLFTERRAEVKLNPVEDVGTEEEENEERVESAPDDGGPDAWRDEEVGAIFDTSPPPKPVTERGGIRDPLSEFVEHELRRQQEHRVHARDRVLERLRSRRKTDAHVCVEPSGRASPRDQRRDCSPP